MGPTYKRVTTNVLQEMKNSGEKISMLTAYDYTLAKIVDNAGIDVILVGDSAVARCLQITYQTTVETTPPQTGPPCQKLATHSSATRCTVKLPMRLIG